MEIEAECSGTTTNNAEELVEEEGGGGGDRWSILIGDGKAAAAAAAAATAAVYLLWEDLTVLLPNFIRSSGGGRPRSHTKRLLNAITGFALPGRIMAIMGPSGSGKSTLLDSLAGNTYIHTYIYWCICVAAGYIPAFLLVELWYKIYQKQKLFFGQCSQKED